MVLCCTILAHRHNAFIEYFIFHTNIFHFQLFIKDSIVMAIKNKRRINLNCFIVIEDDKDFFS